MDSSTLPFDIVSIVVNLAHDNGGSVTLRNCAQVNRVFHAASRPLIFRSVKLSSIDSLEALEALLNIDPDIGIHVHILVVQPLAQPPTFSSWLSAIPRCLPARLIRLRHLELVNLHDRGGYCNAQFFVGCSAFTSVEKLTMRDSVIELHLLYSFTCAFPNLTHILVGSLRPVLAAYYPYPPQLYDPRLTLVTLDVGHLYINALKDFFRWLAQTASVNTLRSFGVAIRLTEVSHIIPYLTEHGDLLEELSLDISGHAEAEAQGAGGSNVLSIASCTSLRLLTLHNFDPTSTTMLSYLTGISSPYFEELKLGITAADDLDEIPMFTSVARILEFASVYTLQRLIFVYRGPLPVDKVLQRLQGSFTDPRHRDIIRVLTVV